MRNLNRKIDIIYQGKKYEASLELYVQNKISDVMVSQKRPLIIVCPGGGYEHLSPREGDPTLIQFLSKGFNVALLAYSVNSPFPVALMQLAKTVLSIRKVKETSIDTSKIFICGFSAGGHLAACLGTLYQHPILKSFAPNKFLRPAGLILCYPVITASGTYAHHQSIQNLQIRSEQKELISIEKNVTSNFPPTFIWQTQADKSVPIQNSLLLVNKLISKQVPCEFHLFPKGGHGLGIGTPETLLESKKAQFNSNTSAWVDLCSNWIKNEITN